MSQDMMALINTLTTNDSWTTRRDAAKALADFKESAAVDALIGALNNDDKHVVRYFAAEALGNIGDERAIPHLSKGLHHSEQTVQKHCAEALAKFGSQATEILSSAIRGEDTAQRSIAVDAINKANDPQFKDLLLEAVHDPNPWVAIGAINALGDLGDLGDPSVSNTLLELLEGNSDVKFVAAVKYTLDELGADATEAVARAESRAEEAFLAGLKALKVGMSESEVNRLVGGGVFQSGMNIVYRNKYGEFQLIFANERLIEIPEAFGPSRLIEKMEAELSRNKWWQFWK